MICLDTHVVAWLYAGEIDRITKRVQKRIEAEDLGISPIVLLELQYLHEIGRITDEASVMMQSLGQSIGLVVCTESFERVITESLTQRWTRDPFDRIIVAQAQVGNHPLMTQDLTIRRHCSLAYW